MDQGNIMFMGNMDNLYAIVDLFQNKFFRYKDSYNYYDIDVKIVPLQLKTKNFYNELNTFGNNNRVMFIQNDHREFFRKCREIWNKIIELIGINNP